MKGATAEPWLNTIKAPNKNKTIIKDDAFIGSNVSLVAPVKIGKNSLIGAGSVITKDIPNENLAVERNKQVNIKKKKK